MLLPLNSKPGIQRDGTQAAAEAYLDGQWVRFQRGLPRKMGGYSWLSTAAITGTPRTIHVDVRDGGATTYVLTDTGAFSLRDSGSGYGGLVDHNALMPPGTEAVTWTIDVMYSGLGGSSIVTSLPVRDADNIAKEVVGQLLYGTAGALTPFLPVDDENGDPVEGVGVVCLQPFTVVYGNDGLIRNSNANNISAASGWVQGGGNYASTANVMGSRVIAAKAMEGGGASPAGLFWGVTDLLKMSFIGGQAIWQYDTLSTRISVLGRNSVIEVDGVFYWAGVDRFFAYDGQVREVPNTFNSNWFFDGINWGSRNKVWAANVPRFGEIWWFYPRGTDTECGHAVIYNYKENSWYDAALIRSAGDYDLYNGHPLWAAPSGFEILSVGTTENVSALSATEAVSGWGTASFATGSVGHATTLAGGATASGFPYFVGFDGSANLYRADSASITTGVVTSTSLVTPLTAVNLLELDPASGALYIGTSGGTSLRKSTDSGATWSSALSFSPSVSAADMAAYNDKLAVVCTSSTAALSATAGASWSSVSTTVQASKVAVSGTNVLFTPVANSVGPYKTTIGGGAATLQSIAPASNGEVWQLLPGVVPAGERQAWMRANGNFVLSVSTDANKCYTSSDGGATFVQRGLVAGVSPLLDVPVGAVSSGQRALVCLNATTSSYKTLDGGATWTLITDPGTPGALVYADTDNSGNWVATKSGQFLRSRDDLVSFDNIATPNGNSSSNWRAVYCGSGVWLATPGDGSTVNVYRCTNIAATTPTWTPIAAPVALYRLFTDRFGNVLGTAFNSATVRVSHDSGLTWGTATLTPTLYNFAAFNVYTAASSGTQWMMTYRSSATLDYITAISSNGGDTWAATPTQPINYFDRYSNLSYSAGKYLALSGSGVFGGLLNRSTDVGTTWAVASLLPAGSSVTGVNVLGDALVVAPAGATYCPASTDGGSTWLTTLVPPAKLPVTTMSPTGAVVYCDGSGAASGVWRAPSVGGTYTFYSTSLSPSATSGLFVSWLTSRAVAWGATVTSGGSTSWAVSTNDGVTWGAGNCVVPLGVLAMGVVANSLLRLTGKNVIVGAGGFAFIENSPTVSFATESIVTVYFDNTLTSSAPRRCSFSSIGAALLLGGDTGLGFVLAERAGRWAVVPSVGSGPSAGYAPEVQFTSRNSATGTALVPNAAGTIVCRIGSDVTFQVAVTASGVSGSDPATNTWLRALTPTSVSVSTDDALTWSTVASSGGDSAVFIRGNSGTWVAGLTSGAIVRSTDNGVTWVPTTHPALTTLLTADYDAGVWYVLAGVPYGVLKSVDGGFTWAFVSGAPNGSHLEAGAGAVIVSGGSGVWRSTNAGVSWTQVSAVPLLYAATDKSGNWVSPGVGDAPADVPYRSVDNGATWAAYPRTSTTGGGSTATTGGVLPDNTLVLPTATSQNLMVSADEGYTWSVVPVVGVPSFVATCCVAQGGRVLLCSTTDDQVWFSDDLANWYKSDTTAAVGTRSSVGFSPTYGVFSTSSQPSVAWSPLTPVSYKWADVAADGAGRVVMLSAVGAVAVSTDSGVTWEFGFMPGGRLSTESWVSVKHRNDTFFAMRSDLASVSTASTDLLDWDSTAIDGSPMGDGAWVAAVGNSQYNMASVRYGTTVPVFKVTQIGGDPDTVVVVLSAPVSFDPDGYLFTSVPLEGRIVAHSGATLYVQGTLPGGPEAAFPGGVNKTIGTISLGQAATATLVPSVGSPVVVEGTIVGVLASGVTMSLPEGFVPTTYTSATVVTATGNAESVSGVFVEEAARLAEQEVGTDEVLGSEVTAIPSSFTTHEMSMTTMLSVFREVDPAQQTRVDKIVPDFRNTGDLTAEVLGRDYPQQTAEPLASVTIGTEPFNTLQAQKGRLRFRFSSNVVGGHYESGIQRADLSPGDARASGA